MANQIALRCQTQTGDELLVEAGAHPPHYEAGAPARIAGVLLRAVAGQAFVLDARQLAEHFRPEDVHVAPLTVVCVEDTANRGGGTVWPLQDLDDVAKVAHDQGAAAHMDGARLFNAVDARAPPSLTETAGQSQVALPE